MRDFLLFNFILISLFSFSQIPNYEFEDWTDLEIKKPKEWIMSGNASITSDASEGSNAIKLINTASNNAVGLVANTIVSNNLSGGSAYTDIPLVFRFDVKYNLAAGDLAKAIAIFKARGQAIATVEFDINGNSADTFETYKVPIQWVVSTAPDTVVVVFISNDFDSPSLNGDGEVIFDNIIFESFGQPNDQIENNGFEDSDVTKISHPENWYTTNNYANKVFGFDYDIESVVKSDEAHHGSSVLLQNTVINGDILPGIAVTGNTFSENFPPAFAINTKPKYLQGYYKYQPEERDTGLIAVFFYNKGQTIGAGQLGFVSTVDEITYFSFPINYFGNPDSASILISSCNLDRPRGNESKLWIDKLSFTNTIAGIVEISKSQQIYPNPATEFITIDNSGFERVDIINQYGKVVLSSTNSLININSLSNGSYTLRVFKGKVILNSKFVKL